MNNKLPLLAGATLLLALFASGCEQATPPPVDAVAQVNSSYVTESQLLAFMQVRRHPTDDPAAREAALTELIDLHLLAEAADQAGLIDDATRAQVKVQELSLLANKALARFAQGQAVSDEDVQLEYQRQIQLTGGAEYRIKHLLVPDQMQAIAAIERLKQGELFADLVTSVAEDGSAGDLGWVNLAQVPPAFSNVLRGLTPGSYSPTPISSEYGWHVVFLEDVREFAPPQLETVEEGIRNSLSRTRLEGYLDKLRQAAQVNRLGQ